MSLETLLGRSPVVPVVAVEDPADAAPLARALHADGRGLGTVEMTLRTPAGVEAIARIADEVPEIAVGAGTVCTPEQVTATAAAGARFLVAPGCTPALLDAMLASGVPALPGACTPSEAMALRERGLRVLKLFPAVASGGLPQLRALAGPFPDVSFCPTGGITPQTAPEWLALPTVRCVGGTWIAPADDVRAGRFARIAERAVAAAQLAEPYAIAST